MIKIRALDPDPVRTSVLAALVAIPGPPGEPGLVLVEVELSTDQYGQMHVTCPEYTAQDVIDMVTQGQAVLLWAFVDDSRDSLYLLPHSIDSSTDTVTWTGTDAIGRTLTVTAAPSDSWGVSYDDRVERAPLVLHATDDSVLETAEDFWAASNSGRRVRLSYMGEIFPAYELKLGSFPGARTRLIFWRMVPESFTATRPSGAQLEWVSLLVPAVLDNALIFEATGSETIGADEIATDAEVEQMLDDIFS